MHPKLNRWLEELEEETKILTSELINEEARGNLVAFGFDRDSLEEWGRESVCRFLMGCADLYQRKSGNLRMVFYSWFDEQAGQIRISAVSQSHGKLPFGCELNPIDLDCVVDGIYLGDSGLCTRGALDVWRQNT